MAKEFEGEALSWRRVDDVLEVTLHAEPLNEIGSPMVRELNKLASTINGGALGAKAVLLASQQAGFSSGADLRELHAGLGEHMNAQGRLAGDGRRKATQRLGRFLDDVHRAFNGIDRAPVPTVCALHGVCFGGGFELALTCDLRVADQTARFAFPELRLGIVPGFGGIPRLEREVGQAIVREFLFTGRSLGAARAHTWGIVGQVVPRGRAIEVARGVAHQLTRYRPGVVAQAKRYTKALPAARLAEERALFRKQVLAPEVFEALDRFVHSNDIRPYLAPQSAERAP